MVYKISRTNNKSCYEYNVCTCYSLKCVIAKKLTTNISTKSIVYSFAIQL